MQPRISESVSETADGVRATAPAMAPAAAWTSAKLTAGQLGRALRSGVGVEHVGDGAGDTGGARHVQELVGAVGVAARAEHAGDQELRLGEPLAEHRHERDRAALADGARRLAERRLRRRRRRRRGATARTAARSSPAPMSSTVDRRRAAPDGGSPSSGADARRRRPRAGSTVGGSRNESFSVVEARSTLPAMPDGGQAVGADVGERRLPRACPQELERVVAGLEPESVDERERAGDAPCRARRRWRPSRRSGRRGTGVELGHEERAGGGVLDPVEQLRAARRNDDGTTPPAEPECTPSSRTSTREHDADEAAQRRGGPEPVVGGAARSRGRRRATATPMRAPSASMWAGRSGLPDSSLASMSTHAAGVAPAACAGPPRWRSARRRRRSRRRRRRGRRADRRAARA